MKINAVRYNRRFYKGVESIEERLIFLRFYSIQSTQFRNVPDRHLASWEIRK